MFFCLIVGGVVVERGVKDVLFVVDSFGEDFYKFIFENELFKFIKVC